MITFIQLKKLIVQYFILIWMNHQKIKMHMDKKCVLEIFIALKNISVL